MEGFVHRNKPVLIIGNGRLAYSIGVCLLQSGQEVVLCTDDSDAALRAIDTHWADLQGLSYKRPKSGKLEIVNKYERIKYSMAIVITDESLPEKKFIIHQLERDLPANVLIAINTESIPLSVLQQGAVNPERIIGANWTEPAHTTYFLELITNAITKEDLVSSLSHHAKECWKKDPYITVNDSGIRSKMLSAITREAFYLVENGYASIEDIDRACRNDPGYYLSFAGNFRYMDLMGACSYGRVMKDLNPELSKAGQMPHFFTELIQQGHLGMENDKGLYEYGTGETQRWDETFRKYSYQIQEIIEKYPFRYMEENI